jgi:hypothetical protein
MARALLQIACEKPAEKRACVPEQPPDIPLSITHAITFTLPCPVARGVAYLGDPAILLGALPSVERVVARHQGTYRLTLEAIRALGHTLRPAAEIVIAITADRVAIRSVPEPPHLLHPDEIATQVEGNLSLVNTARGCDVHCTLRLAAAIPARAIPPLMPRALAHRTAEGLLGLRLRQDMQAMARALVAGFPAWDAEQQPAARDQ